MRIYSMTATFGKLDHQTLTLKPGLNVIHAPNEWGKSTWCAFLINMLYGIDTRQRSGGAALPDKERYAPWSGMPMAGRIELCWNGRDITIERSTKGRLIFGVFRAYETQSGLDIPELDGTNCGKMLLGVERSVFTRAGFIRLTDMPVTADDALRRRLNDLVTTGDDSGEADKLSSALKELKNKCRYNNSGLLPQAEAEREQLRRQLDQIIDLKSKSASLLQQEERLDQYIAELSNHEATLRYNAAREDTLRVERTEAALESSRQQVEQLQAEMELLPDPNQAQTALDAGNRLQYDLDALNTEKQQLPPPPEQPLIPEHYEGITPDQAVLMAKNHYIRSKELEQEQKRQSRTLTVCLVITGILALAALVCVLAQLLPVTFAAGIAAAVLLTVSSIICAVRSGQLRKEQQEISDLHPGMDRERWIEDAEYYLARQRNYYQAVAEHQRRQEDLQRREQLLTKQIRLFAGECDLQQRLEQWNQALQCQARLDAARKDLQNQQVFLDNLKAMVRPVDAPAMPDRLTLSMTQTQQQLSSARAELQQIHNQLHQCKGRSEALGQEGVLRSRLDTLLRRINRLEDTYYALEMAQDALHRATTTLQRRFAPRISKRAQTIFAGLTDGRYQRLTMADDFSLSVSTQQEDTLHSAQWRSDGTVDQLYLALRLAVSEELTPDAPLVLDDALVRFDDDRLKNAMQLLGQAAENKQVILFTCQKRETEYI